MALPGSGPISIGQVATEFGRANNMAAFYGVASGVPGSGAISLSHFHGKANVFNVTLGGGANVNLRSWLVGQGWNQSAPVVVTITGWVYATYTGVHALVIDGSFPGGLTVHNNGSIIGCGGWGGTGAGAGAQSNRTYYPIHATAGKGGGPALYVRTGVTLYNNGNILGGGGGGGGGAAAYRDEYISVDKGGSSYSGKRIMSGGGGGGGTTVGWAPGGVAGVFSGIRAYYGGDVLQSGGAGTNGDANDGQAGGGGSYYSGVASGAGGRGGWWGAAGAAGLDVSDGNRRHAWNAGGGGGGVCIDGNGYISYGAYGGRYGAIY